MAWVGSFQRVTRLPFTSFTMPAYPLSATRCRRRQAPGVLQTCSSAASVVPPTRGGGVFLLGLRVRTSCRVSAPRARRSRGEDVLRFLTYPQYSRSGSSPAARLGGRSPICGVVADPTCVFVPTPPRGGNVLCVQGTGSWLDAAATEEEWAIPCQHRGTDVQPRRT